MASAAGETGVATVGGEVKNPLIDKVGDETPGSLPSRQTTAGTFAFSFPYPAVLVFVLLSHLPAAVRGQLQAAESQCRHRN